MIDIAPSLLAADPLRLYDSISTAVDAGVKTLHIDVMDAHFVPNLAFSPAVCAAIRRAFPALTLDAHLMMDNAMAYVEAFARAGVNRLTVHVETLSDVRAALMRIKSFSMSSGLSLKPETPVDALFPYLSDMDRALMMTVQPGFGGQSLMTDQIPKIARLREVGYLGDIAVDGGLTAENAVKLIAAGATTLIMGTSFFSAPDKKALIERLIG